MLDRALQERAEEGVVDDDERRPALPPPISAATEATSAMSAMAPVGFAGRLDVDQRQRPGRRGLARRRQHGVAVEPVGEAEAPTPNPAMSPVSSPSVPP